MVGKITYHGGEWPKPVNVSFVIQQPEPGFPLHSGSAELNRDGTFKASTFDAADGLVPGTYNVNLTPGYDPENPSTAKDNPIPPKYRQGNTSGFQVKVPKDAQQAIEVNFDVPAT